MAEPRVMDDGRAIDGDLMAQLFPQKSDEKRALWLKELNDQEYDSVGQLKAATDEAWKTLNLPVAVKDTLKKALLSPTAQPPTTSTAAAAAVAAATPSTSAAAPTAPVDSHPIVQIDVILFDVSGSMRSRSFDREKTRAEAGKILFQSMIDHMAGAELQHALQLITFGERLTERPFCRDFSKLETALGELSTDEGATMLWDAIDAGCRNIVQFRKDHPELPKICPARIFCLTDGEDTRSKAQHWMVAQRLRQNDVILDAFPLADPNQWLQAMAACTGGLCLKVTTTTAGISLFEREAVLSVSARECDTLPPMPIDETGLTSLFSSERTKAQEDVRSVVSKSVAAPTLFGAYEVALAAKKATTEATQRIFKELKQLTDNPIPGTLGAWPNADDVMYWKVLIAGPAKTPYEGGVWCVLVQFPLDYPRHPPVLKFAPQTPMYHLSVSGDGKICMDILSHSWTPTMSISRVLVSLFSILESPNADDPLDTYKASVFRDDRERYNTEARRFSAANANKTVEQLRKIFGVDV